MKRDFLSLALTLTVVAGVPAARSTGLVDLGPAGPAGFDSHISTDKPPYIVDVSKDGTLAGGTDSSGHIFIWTAACGKVTIATNFWLVGVDWLVIFTGNYVLAVGNYCGPNYPLSWQGNADGTVGLWRSLPLEDYQYSWTATALGVMADASEWWVAGYRNSQGSPYEMPVCYQGSTDIATSIPSPSGGHPRSFFYAVSDEGTFAGVSQYGGSPPDGGSRNGDEWYYGIITGGLGDAALYCGPPEAGDGRAVSASDACLADAVSGDGSILGGGDKSSAVRPALFWTRDRHVYKLPLLPLGVRSGTNYSADSMGIRALSKDGCVMGGYYYPDPPTDSGPVEAFVFYLSSYNAGPPSDPNSVTGTLFKVGNLLGTYGIRTNGWTFREVTALSDDGYTLAGYGVTNGVTHNWLAQLPPAVIRITHIGLDGSCNAVINFTSTGMPDTRTSFAVEQSAAVLNGGTSFADMVPAATITGSNGSFQAICPQNGDAQFYCIRHL